MRRGNHSFGLSGTCDGCGVCIEAVQDNIASPWCDYLEPTGHSDLASLAHIIAIVIFIGAPLYAMMIPAQTFSPPMAVQVLFAAFIALAGVAIASIHAGLWDWLIEEPE